MCGYRLAQPDSEVVVKGEVAGDRDADGCAAGEHQHPGGLRIFGGGGRVERVTVDVVAVLVSQGTLLSGPGECPRQCQVSQMLQRQVSPLLRRQVRPGLGPLRSPTPMPRARRPPAAATKPAARSGGQRRLASQAGLIAAGIALFICYLHVSRTEAVSSDGAANALQAWNMLHGNPLLSGWLLGHVSFYTTELPEYMLVEAIRGLSADVLHVSAAITYTLLVLVAGLLARGRATGREGMLRMLIAAGIMVAPQLGPGAFILVFQPDHAGTQVPLLVTWLVLDRAPRSWCVPIVVGMMLAWTEVADSFAVLIGAVPLGAVAVVRAYQALVQRREPMRSGWFDLSLVAAAGLSVVAASVAVKLIGDHGGYSVLAIPTAWLPPV